MSLLVLLSAELGVSVGNLNSELLSALNDLLALKCGNVVCNLSTVLAVVHEEELKVSNVVHNELVEAIWKLNWNESISNSDRIPCALRPRR